MNKLNIWYGTNENAWLSNLSERPFIFNDKRFISVEHAYQTWKSGRFDHITYNSYKTGGVKIIGRFKANRNINIKLMERLIYESFKQNPEITSKLLELGNVEFEHKYDNSIWKTEFPRILKMVQQLLINMI